MSLVILYTTSRSKCSRIHLQYSEVPSFVAVVARFRVSRKSFQFRKNDLRPRPTSLVVVVVSWWFAIFLPHPPPHLLWHVVFSIYHVIADGPTKLRTASENRKPDEREREKTSSSWSVRVLFTIVEGTKPAWNKHRHTNTHWCGAT